MARRRQRGQVASAVGHGLGDAFGALQQYYQRQGLLEEQNKAALERQRALAADQETQKLMDQLTRGEIFPEQALARLPVPPGVDTTQIKTRLEAMMPPGARRRPFEKALEAAKTPEALTQLEMDAPALFRQGGLPTEPEFPAAAFGKRAATTTEPGTLPSAQYGPEVPPELGTALTNIRKLRTGLEHAPAQLETFQNAVSPESPTGELGPLVRNKYDLAREVAEKGSVFVPSSEQGRTPAQMAARTAGTLQEELANRVPELTGEIAGKTERAKAGAGFSPVELGQRAGQEVLEKAKIMHDEEVRLAGDKRRAEMAGEIGPSGGFTSQQQSAILQLGGDFAQQSRDFYTIQEQMQRIAGLVNSPRSPASDLALVVSFSKMNDANSAVMQGEQETAKQAVSILDKARGLYRIAADKVLPQEWFDDFVNQARNIYTAGVTQHQERVRDFSERAQGLGVPPAFVVRQPSQPLQAPGAGAPSDPFERLMTRPAPGRR